MTFLKNASFLKYSLFFIAPPPTFTPATPTASAVAAVAAAPAIVDEQRSPKFEQKEPSDALSHLPKKQQELFLRIQQHQKQAEIDQVRIGKLLHWSFSYLLIISFVSLECQYR